MIIRKEQMDVLSKYMSRCFEDDMVVHLRSRFCKGVEMGEEELRSMVREGIDRATVFGIVARYDVRRYLENMVEYGPNFDKSDWASQILADTTISGRRRMDRIDRYALFMLREGVT